MTTALVITSKETQALDTAAAKINAAFENLLNEAKTIADAYTQFVTTYPHLKVELKKKCNWVPKPMFEKLEAISRKELLPCFLLTKAPWENYVSELSYDAQKTVLEEPVEILVKSDKGTWTKMKKDIRKLPLGLLAQVIDKDNHTLRTKDEQKAWVRVKEQAAINDKAAERAASGVYAISSTGVEIKKSDGNTIIITKRALMKKWNLKKK